MSQSDNTQAFKVFCSEMAQAMNECNERLADGRIDYTASDIAKMPEAINSFILSREIVQVVYNG